MFIEHHPNQVEVEDFEKNRIQEGFLRDLFLTPRGPWYEAALEPRRNSPSVNARRRAANVATRSQAISTIMFLQNPIGFAMLVDVRTDSHFWFHYVLQRICCFRTEGITCRMAKVC